MDPTRDDRMLISCQLLGLGTDGFASNLTLRPEHTFPSPDRQYFSTDLPPPDGARRSPSESWPRCQEGQSWARWMEDLAR